MGIEGLNLAIYDGGVSKDQAKVTKEDPTLYAKDPAIIAALPEGTEIVLVTEHGDTNWSNGLKVETRLKGEEKVYFLKVTYDEENAGMAQAEYEGQKAISAVIPEHAVAPIAWGYLESNKDKSWFLTHFRELQAWPLSSLEQLLTIVEKLHKESQSPTGKFGFHVTPYYGPPPMTVDWTDNWEVFWTREFRSGLKWVQKKLGEDPELAEVAEEFIDKVVPRLLRPLQTGGRNIKPSLCHGDLWHKNVQIIDSTGGLVLFDPCPFYGHHEMDLQCMMISQSPVGKEFVEMYKEKVERSRPENDFDDRHALYAIRNDIMVAGMWSEKWRSLIGNAKQEMRRLIAKHPDGLKGFDGDLTPTKPMDEAVANGENSWGI